MMSSITEAISSPATRYSGQMLSPLGLGRVQMVEEEKRSNVSVVNEGFKP